MTRFSGSRSLVAVVGMTLLACAAPARTAEGQPLRPAGGGYELEVLVDGAPAPRFSHHGDAYVMGRLGDRYTVRVWNRTGRRIEAVVSVDGRDVVDGRPADVRKRGYLVPAYGYVDVDGWRLSGSHAAAFRFSTVAASYAAQTGSARHVGVIGVAVFPERIPPRPLELPAPMWRGAGDEPRAEPGRDDAAGAPRAERSASAQADAPAAAPAKSGSMARENEAVRRRPGLGTEFGEQVRSDVREVSFARAHAGRPAVTLGVRYNDHDGLVALGIDVDGRFGYDDDVALRDSAQPFPASGRSFAAPPVGWRGY